MSFFSVPLSGLNASQSSLQAISNNLANTNTDGYKDQNVTFSDVYSQSGLTNGALNPLQTGQGVNTASTTLDYTNGNTTATGVSSNMALSGNGFFVAQQTNGNIAYSRAGDFTVNKAGQIIAPDGSLILGYPAVGGVVNSQAALQPIQVGLGTIAPATATTTFSATANLNAQDPVLATASSTVTTYDSLGAPHVLTINYTKSNVDQWSYKVVLPGADVGSNIPITLATGTLYFLPSGKLNIGPGAGQTPNPVTLAAITGYSDGAATANIKWNLADANNNPLIQQPALPSGTSTVVQNGNPAATLTDFTVLADGTVQGKYSQGPSAVIGQVAIATVANNQGLQQIGNNLFVTTAGSGDAQVGIAGTAGRGTIKGGYVEGSNVNIAAEFSKMIVAQQSYQANAKVVTTFNQVEQATLAMLQG